MKKKVLQRRYGGYLLEPLSENLIPQKNLSLKWRKRLRKRWGGRLLSSSLGRGLKNLYQKQNLHFPIQSSLSQGVTSGEVSGWTTLPAKRLLEENSNHSLNNSGLTPYGVTAKQPLPLDLHRGTRGIPFLKVTSEDLPSLRRRENPSSSFIKGGEDFFVEMDVYGKMVGVTPKRVRVEPFKPVFSAPLSLYGVHQFLHFKRKSYSERIPNPYRLVRNPPLSYPSRGSGVHPNLKLNSKPFQGVPLVLTSKQVRTGERAGLPLKGSEKVYLSSSLQIKGELTRLEGYKKSSLFKSQLSERKKLSIFYGNLSRRKLFEVFNFNGGKENSLSLLERRADVALYRIGFFTTILSARQWIRHGRVFLNGQTLQVGSFLLSPGDSLSIPSRYHRFFMGFRGTKVSQRGGFSSPPLFLRGGFSKGSKPLQKGVKGGELFKYYSQKTDGTSDPRGVTLLQREEVTTHTPLQQWAPFVTPHWLTSPLVTPFGVRGTETGVTLKGVTSTPGNTSSLSKRVTPLGSEVRGVKEGFTLSFLLPSFRLGAPQRLLLNQLIRGFPFHLKRRGLPVPLPFGTGNTPNPLKGLGAEWGVRVPRDCEKNLFSPLKLYRKVTEEGGFSPTQPPLVHPQKRRRGLEVSTGEVRNGGVTPRGVTRTYPLSGVSHTATQKKVPRTPGYTTPFRVRGTTFGVRGRGGENFPSPVKYLGGGRWSYSSRLPASTLLEVTSEKREEFFTPFHKRGGGYREAPRGGLPQSRFKRSSLGGRNSLGIKPLKPTHLEVSYTHLTVIYLYYPQKISFPALMDLETIERSFRCGI